LSCTVVAGDARSEGAVRQLPVDVETLGRLAGEAATYEGGDGELTLTFVDGGEMAELNAKHMGKSGPTDVLSFPMEDDPVVGIPTLLGDIVVCPDVAAERYGDHAGTFEDELALLVVHGVLHVLGHDHATPRETATMRDRELALLTEYHWRGPAPAGFRQSHD
jgi:probable rRNA maturation factor